MTLVLGRVLVKSHHRYTVDHPKACSDSSVFCWRCENADQSPGMLFPNQQTSQRWIYYCNMRMQESRYLLLNCSLHFFICFSFLAPKATSHPTHDDSLSTKYSDVSKHIFVNFTKIPEITLFETFIILLQDLWVALKIWQMMMFCCTQVCLFLCSSKGIHLSLPQLKFHEVWYFFLKNPCLIVYQPL